jgi:hypothetical protein
MKMLNSLGETKCPEPVTIPPHLETTLAGFVYNRESTGNMNENKE